MNNRLNLDIYSSTSHYVIISVHMQSIHNTEY